MRENDTFRLLENPEHAPLVVLAIFLVVFVLPEIVVYL